MGSRTLWTSDVFAEHNHGIKASTARMRWKSIPGSQKILDEVLFWPGSRYPFNTWWYNIDTCADRMYVLLKAISKFRYISHNELYLTEDQFNIILNDFLSKGYIRPNESGNPYGANAYDITQAGSNYLKSLDDATREERVAAINQFFKSAKDLKDLITPIPGTSE